VVAGLSRTIGPLDRDIGPSYIALQRLSPTVYWEALTFRAEWVRKAVNVDRCSYWYKIAPHVNMLYISLANRKYTAVFWSRFRRSQRNTCGSFH
jgi:hypothetical protein